MPCVCQLAPRTVVNSRAPPPLACLTPGPGQPPPAPHTQPATQSSRQTDGCHSGGCQTSRSERLLLGRHMPAAAPLCRVGVQRSINMYTHASAYRQCTAAPLNVPKVATAPPKLCPQSTTRPTRPGPPVSRAATLSSVSCVGCTGPSSDPTATECSPRAPRSCCRNPVCTLTPACQGKSSACSCWACLRSCSTSWVVRSTSGQQAVDEQSAHA